MEYIHKIRAKVGHEKLLMPANAVVVRNASGEILLHVRGESGEWGLPGGLMDLEETAAEGAIREVKEETGLDVRALTLYGVFSGPGFEVQYPNGDRTAPVILGFYTEQFSGDLRISAESPEVRFFPLERLPTPMNRFHAEFVAAYLEFQREGGRRTILR